MVISTRGLKPQPASSFHLFWRASLGTLLLAACSPSPHSALEPECATASRGLLATQDFQLQGFQTQGFQTQGTSVLISWIQGGRLEGAPLQQGRVEKGELVAEVLLPEAEATPRTEPPPSKRTLRGEALTGATLQGMIGASAREPGQKVHLRIAEVLNAAEMPIGPQGTVWDPSGDTWLYRVERWDPEAASGARSAAHGLPVSVPLLPLCSRPLRPIGLLSFLYATADGDLAWPRGGPRAGAS